MAGLPNRSSSLLLNLARLALASGAEHREQCASSSLDLSGACPLSSLLEPCPVSLGTNPGLPHRAETSDPCQTTPDHQSTADQQLITSMLRSPFEARRTAQLSPNKTRQPTELQIKQLLLSVTKLQVVRYTAKTNGDDRFFSGNAPRDLWEVPFSGFQHPHPIKLCFG